MNIAAGAECESRLHTALLERAVYFDYERLIATPHEQLREMQPVLTNLVNGLAEKFKANQAAIMAAQSRLPKSFQMSPYAEQVKMQEAVGLPHLVELHETLEEQKRGVQRYADAVTRALTATHAPETPAGVLILDLHVGGKTDTQVMAEITAMGDHLPGGKDAQALRFFPNAREDLVRAHGTDLAGREFNSGNAWDLFGLEAILADRGLQAEDGLYAVPHEIAHDFGKRANGESIPFSMVQDFMRGARALAVYDMTQLEDLNTDFFIFKNPPEKRKALLAIIRPRR